MISGVIIKKVVKHEDDRGFFAELIKFGEETFHEVLQTSYSETKPGVIKAWHIHPYWEVWCIIKGQAKVVLHDMRPDSPTNGQTDVISTGEDNMMVIAIPGEVAHGYVPLGDKPMGIIYHASEAYDPKNIKIRNIPYDDPDINFDWN
jgi:dTDP-4-dehydrorhamnose 3,5-epimerase